MTNRYTHLAQEHKAQAVAKLSKLMQGEQSATENQTATVAARVKRGDQRGFESEVGTKPEHLFSEKGTWTRNPERFQA
jgi:hypothetical protein